MSSTVSSVHPGYVFKGKSYKTPHGIFCALFKDSNATQISTVSKDHKIRAYGTDRKTVIAVYSVSPPKFGETQQITRDVLPIPSVISATGAR